MQQKIFVSFNSAWVLSKRHDDKLPVERLLDVLKNDLEIEILHATPLRCEVVIKDENFTKEQLENRITQIIKQLFSAEAGEAIAKCEVSEYVPPKKFEEAAEENANAGETEEAPDNAESAVQKIHALVGAEEFKDLVDECVKVAPGLIKYNTVESFTHRCYLFAVNDGNGLTTYLHRFADLLRELKLFRFAEEGYVIEETLASPQTKEIGYSPFSTVYAHLKKRYGARGGRLICIDISEWMTKTGDKEFREFLSTIDDHAGENIYVFRVPFVEKDVLAELKKSLSDILYVSDVSFVPFDRDELTQCAREDLDKRGFSMEDDAWEVFNARITEEKNDGRFYGINTVHKVILEMIYHKQLHNATNGVDDMVIKKEEIRDLTSLYGKQEESGLEMLDKFVGMEAIRARVEEIVAQIEALCENPGLGAPCLHMRFVGNPGTGKTTVARAIGKILKEKGILRNGNFFEHAGRDFCGRYVGETAPKTATMCRDAYGSVMFIDEAYSLYRADGYSSVDYGREAIDTLVAEMENHRSDLVVIMAGYPEEMETLMKANAGLESRMPYLIEFPNYTREQLFEIFMRMTKEVFTWKDGFEEAVKAYFEALPDEVLRSKEFSNARFVRNLFERTWGKAVLRKQLSKDRSMQLTKEDFMLASSEKEFSKIMRKQGRTLGFI